MQGYKTITQSDIKSVFEDFINAEKMFTAFDITKTLRNNGFFVEHKEVKSELINYETYYMPNYDYVKTLNHTLNAYVYHNKSDDPTEYDPNAVKNCLVSAQPVSNTTTTTTSSADDLLDKRGRYSIPCSYVINAGFSEYTYVYFKTNVTGNLIIGKADSLDDKNATVDCKLNIRVPKYIFLNAFGKIPQRGELHIQSEPDKIIISL